MSVITGTPKWTCALTMGGSLRATDADDDGKRQITEHLGSILRPNTLMVLFGAGASFHISGPRIRAVDIDDISAMLSAVGAALTDANREIIRWLCPVDRFNFEGLLE